MDTLKFGIEFDIDPAVDGLEELGEAAEGVGAGLAERLSGAGEALSDFGIEGSRSSRAIQGFASAISLVSPEAAAAARSVAMLARGLGILRLGMGPLAVGFAAVTAAVMLFQRQQAEADATRQRSIALAEASKVADDKLTTAREALAVATGDLTAEEVKINQIRRQGMIEALPAFKQHVEAIGEEQAAVETLRTRLADLEKQRAGAASRMASETGRMGENTDGVRYAAQGHQQLTTNLSRTRTELAAKEKALTAAQGALAAYTEKTKELIKTEVAVVEVTKENEDAVKSLAAAEKRRAEQLKNVAISQQNAQQSAEDYRGAMGELAKMSADASASVLTGIDAVINARDRSLAQAREEFRLANAAAQSQAQAAAARAQYTAAEVALEKQAAFEIEKVRAEAAAEEKQRQDEAASRAAAQRATEQDAIIQGYTQTAAAVSDVTALLADKLAENGKRGALALFRISQASALTEIAINTLVARSKALAVLGPIAGPIAARGITISGLASAVAVAAQAPPEVKHGGGVLAPDEEYRRGGRLVTTRREGVVNGPGMDVLGEKGLRDLNAGHFPGGGRVREVYPWKNLDREIHRLSRLNSRTGKALRKRTRDPQTGW
jgi:chemotaxis protein histidine kinase CheA